MSPTTTTKPTAKAKKPAAAAHAEKSVDGLDRIGTSLEALQDMLSSMRGHVGTGARDLMKDAERTAKDTRRDLTKLAKALRTDIADMQAAMSGEHEHKPAPRKPAARNRG